MIVFDGHIDFVSMKSLENAFDFGPSLGKMNTVNNFATCVQVLPLPWQFYNNTIAFHKCSVKMIPLLKGFKMHQLRWIFQERCPIYVPSCGQGIYMIRPASTIVARFFGGFVSRNRQTNPPLHTRIPSGLLMNNYYKHFKLRIFPM